MHILQFLPAGEHAQKHETGSHNSIVKKKTVVIQGLGFVGAAMALVVASNPNDLYDVIGVDLPSNAGVIDKLNAGEFPVRSSDPKVSECFEVARRRNNFRATSDQGVYARADVVVVDINLDVHKGVRDEHLDTSYSVTLDPFRDAIRSIAAVCKQDVLVLVESTVPPGTCKKLVKPVFEEEFRKRNLPCEFMIGHSYERVMPGPGYIDSIRNFYRVYSGIDEKSADAVEAFLKTIISTDEYPLTRLGNTTASEMAKVLENSFRAMNIAFIQEWTEFAETADVNLFEIIDAIRMRPTHRNIMKPGLGVGGYCLTKDPLLASWSSQHLFGAKRLPQSERAVEINDQMPGHTLGLILQHFREGIADKNILILGISYLPNVGDTRSTPVDPLFAALRDRQVRLALHDPYVPFWEEYQLETCSDEETQTGDYDAVILGTAHKTYFDDSLLHKILNANKPMALFDPHGSVSDPIRAGFPQHSYIVTGRGDV